MEKLKVAVLGATGMVGQRFIEALVDHPYFEIGALAASAGRGGVRYADTGRWRLDAELPEEIGDMKLITMEVEEIKKAGVSIAFSALPSEIADDLERALAHEGIAVFSNAASHRMDPDVPLLIPEINHETVDMVKGRRGFIITNANCSTTGLAIPLKVLEPLGITRVFVSTYQAISGAGYPGIPSMDIMGNVVPYIKKEEEKIEIEAKKILGSYDPKAKRVTDADFQVHASCMRIPVIDGHMEAAEVEVQNRPDVEQVVELMESFEAPEHVRSLPTAPERPVIYLREPDRPQHRYDVNAGRPHRAWGMAVTVGRAKVVDNYVRVVLLSHNTRRGAAAGSVLNAELAYEKGCFDYVSDAAMVSSSGVE
ncbi:MAG: aspartate-semialdehyde dehydrogenase [Spirochaetota bacterium]